jgi:hypothetical protein
MTIDQCVFRRMRRITVTLIALALSLVASLSETTKPFPTHWGAPPPIQTRDFVELPGGYGHGSSTLAKWIAANLEKDKDVSGSANAARLYSNDFESTGIGALPDGFLVLAGDFAVKEDGTNKVLELPGAPLDSFSTQFGPRVGEDAAVSARIFSSAQGRRYPTFGVGLGGLSGYQLQISPAKDALEIYKDMEPKTAVDYKWQPGVWTATRFEIHKINDTEWRIEGKVWPAGNPEPSAPQIVLAAKEPPPSGRASVFGSPFSGKPILFDDLVVEKTPPVKE